MGSANLLGSRKTRPGPSDCPVGFVPRNFRKGTVAKRRYDVKVNLPEISVQAFRKNKNGRAHCHFETLRKWRAAWHRNFGFQICWTFQRPRLNKTMLTVAMKPSAMTMDQKTPLECIRAGIARKKARGISKSQKPKKFTMVGVTVSPAPLKAWSMTM